MPLATCPSSAYEVQKYISQSPHPGPCQRGQAQGGARSVGTLREDPSIASLADEQRNHSALRGPQAQKRPNEK